MEREDSKNSCGDAIAAYHNTFLVNIFRKHNCRPYAYSKLGFVIKRHTFAACERYLYIPFP